MPNPINGVGWKTIAVGAIALGLSATGWVAATQIDTVKDHEKRITRIEANYDHIKESLNAIAKAVEKR